MTLDSTFWPILALRNLVIVPGMSVPIRVGRSQSILALKRAQTMAQGSATQIVTVLQRNSNDETGNTTVSAGDLYRVGVICEIEKIKGNEQEGYQLFIKGLERVRILEPRESGAGRMLESQIEILEEKKTSPPSTE